MEPVKIEVVFLRMLAAAGVIVLGACLGDIYSLADVGGKIAVLMTTATLGLGVAIGAAALSWWVNP